MAKLEEPSLPETETESKGFLGIFRKSESSQIDSRQEVLSKKEKLLKDLAIAISDKKKKLLALEDTLAKKFQDLEAKKAELDEREANLTKATKDSSKSILDLSTKRAKLEKEISKLDEKKKALDTDIKMTSAELAKAVSNMKDQQKRFDADTKNLQKEWEQIAKRKTGLDGIQEKLLKMKDEIIERENRVKESEKKITEMNYLQITITKDIEGMNKEKEALQNQILDLKHQVEMETNSLDMIRKELEEHRQGLATEKQMLFNKEREILSRIETLENDEKLLREREEEVVQAVQKMEEEQKVMKEEEKILTRKIAQFQKEKMDNDAQREWVEEQKEKLNKKLEAKIKVLMVEINKAKKYNEKVRNSQDYRARIDALQKTHEERKNELQKLTKGLIKKKKEVMVNEKILSNLVRRIHELGGDAEMAPKKAMITERRSAAPAAQEEVPRPNIEFEKSHEAGSKELPSYEEVQQMARQVFGGEAQTPGPAQVTSAPKIIVPEIRPAAPELTAPSLTVPTGSGLVMEMPPGAGPAQPQIQKPTAVPLQAPAISQTGKKEEKRGLFTRVFQKGQPDDKMKDTFMKKAMVKISERYPNMTPSEKQKKADELWLKYQKLQEA
ncbi:hypothetical protein JW968_06470 [Candidatus Woesearchaeota archaeon]|nr:hypothetical protein [Candidatus Woesearchaeota archaeon]